MKKIPILLLVFAVIFISGCSGKINLKSENMLAVNPSDTSEEVVKVEPVFGSQEINLLIEPPETVGLKVTPSIKKGEVSVYRGIFPDILFGEYYPGRIRWNGIVRQDDGKEFFAQFLLSPVGIQGYFTWSIVVDGKPDRTARIVQLSTDLNFGYSPYGDEFLIEKRFDFLGDKDGYREKILSKGTLLSEIKKIDTGEFYRDYIGKWNVWSYGEEKILSPLGLREVQDIASINPQYGYMQKLVAEGRFMICLDPIATTASAAIDFISANGAPSKGWDYTSELPNRRDMGLIIAWVAEMKRKVQ
ncbi:MAG: hypothetical protein RBR98_00270 [Candidatus Moranbacteria bacterium]|jgi:hypothetical protein|nr:hypothetical protein [Candidatus Moranbacteria bacterium]NLC31191.1 hypothetical protein [Candidatus Moranbacteria bacterium]